jgi:isochorismate hydrolase
LDEFPIACSNIFTGKFLNIPILATTQNAARLGETHASLQLDVENGYKTAIHADKTLFSMITPDVLSALNKLPYHSTGPRQPSGHDADNDTDMPRECVIVGIESHICVLQTALDLKRLGHKVFVLADGVSSCNREEIPIALARLREEGCIVTTSESWLYECVRDAGNLE